MSAALIDYQREIENRQAIQQMETEEKLEIQKFLSAFSPAPFMSQPDLDFRQDDNDDRKKRKQTYNNTKVKARNLLTNASQRKYKPEGFNKATNLAVDT